MLDVGGAERTARKRKQTTQAARAVAAARGGNDRRNVIIGVVIVVVMAVAVIGGVLYTRNSSTSGGAGDIPVTAAHAQYPTKVEDDGTVLAGNESAKVTVDVYEDFLCPACGSFEKLYGEQLEKAVADGKVKARYHILNLLDRYSNPAGYSLEAANAAIAAAGTGKFPDFHASLFRTQPKEGGKGYTQDQLVKLGQAVGISGGDFESAVRGGKYNEQIKKQLEAAGNNPALQRESAQGKSFGTPTIAVNGTMVDLQDAEWLKKAIEQSGQG
ncbi:DsbA family protein [Streptoalloteichus hindustanus]|uniref:DsbA family protein n=1 Tax=Streptoalloteichus hindustanus TaxID=2017 RepID=UPI0009FF1994|nr:thioredoxin domain-containing protein [Streptoalloteichus hindustanus]